MKKRRGIFFVSGCILFILVLYDLVLKINISASAASAGEYLSEYEAGNISGIKNIYMAAVANIVAGGLAALFFYLGRYVFRKRIWASLLMIASLVIAFLNLFSLL